MVQDANTTTKNGAKAKSDEYFTDNIPRPSKNNLNYERTISTKHIMLGTVVTIGIKCTSFIGTQYCIRKFHTPITLGSNVQLELLMIGILFLSREGFRLAITNSSANSNSNSTSNTNNNKISDPVSERSSLQLGGSGVALLTIPLTFIMSIIASFLHYYYYCNLTTVETLGNISVTQPIVSNEYKYSGLLYCLAAFVESCGEPVVLYHLQNLSITEKASAEGIATFGKTITTIICMNQPFFHHQPILSIGIAQLSYAITYCIILYGTLYHRGQFYSVIPLNNLSKIIWWHKQTISLVLLFSMQGVLKFALTEGDRIILSIVANNYNQGIYALGCTYGGLAARLLLQPLEETARLLYGRLASSQVEITTKTQQVQDDDQVSLLRVSYTVFVKMVLYVGLVFCCLGVNYTYVLLNVLAGSTWGNNQEAVRVLSAFCVYTAFLAWNGMTEAFVYGISKTASDIGRLGIAHTITGAIFAVIAPYAVTRRGTLGLVATNCITMLSRTVFSIYYAARYFSQEEGKSISIIIVSILRQMMPAPSVVALSIMAYFGTLQSFKRMMEYIDDGNVLPMSLTWFRLVMEHIGVGISFGVGILSFAYVIEDTFKQNIRTLLREKKA